MGILLSRIARSGELSWCYLMSLLQFEFRRSVRTNTTHKPGRNELLLDSEESPALETVGTQTCEDFRVRRGQMAEPTAETYSAETYSDVSEQCSQPQVHPDTINYLIEDLGKVGRCCYNENANFLEDDRDRALSACTAVSDDVSIFEDPDFSQFGPEYQNLASPRDKMSADREGRAARMSSLSPVKEESETDTSCEEGRTPPGPRTSETFPVFDDVGTVTDRTLPRHGAGPNRSMTPSHGKKLCCSFSSDSGIGDRLHGSNASLSSNCASTSDSDCNSSTRSCDISSAGQAEKLDCCEGASSEVFDHEGPVNKGSNNKEAHSIACCFGSSEKGLRSPHLKDLGNEVSKNADNQKTCFKASIQALRQLNFRARRKVTFSPDIPFDDIPSDAMSCSSDCSFVTTSSTSSSCDFSRSFHPIFSQQDSEESESSMSSEESILAIPLTPPDSPSSPCHSSAFIFPDTDKHCFTEPREGCDLVLLAEGERFHVHSSVVAWQCNALLEHLRETGAREVVLPDKRSDDVLSLLYLLYPYYKKSITERNVESLVEMAHYLGCERVLRMCCSYLIGLAHFSHLCPHRQPLHHPYHTQRHANSPSVLRQTGTRAGSSSPSSSRSPHKDHQLSSLCTCADTVVERLIEILMLAVKYDLDDVYQAYLDVASKMKVGDLVTCPRYKHVSTAMRQDMLMSRVRRLENVVSRVSLKESDLTDCDGRHHPSSRLAYHGELCLRCVSKSVLCQAQNLG